MRFNLMPGIELEIVFLTLVTFLELFLKKQFYFFYFIVAMFLSCSKSKHWEVDLIATLSFNNYTHLI